MWDFIARIGIILPYALLSRLRIDSMGCLDLKYGKKEPMNTAVSLIGLPDAL